MARSAAQELNRIFKDIEKTTESMARSQRLKDLGEFAADMIKKRTRRGRGVKRPGAARANALKGLADSTIKNREFYRKLLHSDTSPRKSNLTFTGQLLESIKLRVRRGAVTIGPRGRRVDIFGKKAKITNDRLAVIVSRDRPFMSLTRGEQKKLAQFYTNTYERLLTRRGLTK